MIHLHHLPPTEDTRAVKILFIVAALLIVGIIGFNFIG